MDVTKLRGEIAAAKEIATIEGIYLFVADDTPEAIVSNLSLQFHRVELYPAKAVSGGVLTANTVGDIYIGLSGAAAAVTLTSLIVAAGVAYGTKAGHGFLEGQNLTLAGGTPAGVNGDVTIFDVGADTFKFRVAASVVNGPATGTITATRTKFLPDKRATTDTDYPVPIILPTGTKMRLNQVVARGKIGDGVFYRAYP